MKKQVILSCIMILVLCAGCASSGDVSEPAAESGSVTESSIDTAVTEDETSEEVATEEAVTEDTVSTAAESESASDNAFIDDYASFEVTSTSLNNGVWNDVISYTDKGSNKSPQLQWSAVEGAGLYVIIMDDPDSWHFMHWKSDNVTETSLDEGWAPESEYVGPYPPSGATRTYEVYVVALKAPVERVKGAFGFSNPKFEENFKALDTDAEGNSGNIIAVGRLAGTFTN
ncbi:MAG: hypothetical protein J5840_03245 [Lachnospiraceae bacterium]|nr:hypothetical protein [Lachnospiraceae bacterium]